MKSVINILLAFAAAALVSVLVDAERSVQIGMAIFTFIAWLWISEAIHISVTALLVPVIASLTGVFSVPEALKSFAHPIIFLFMGGFALAAALQKYDIDRLIAVKIMATAKGVPLLAVLLLFLTTALLSMWISNTATVAMMLPLALGLLRGEDPEEKPKLFLFVLLGLAYSGNVGGVTTLIGSPPNAIAASVIGIDFSSWLKFGIPAFIILFPTMLAFLYFYIRPDFPSKLEHQGDHKKMNGMQMQVALIFVVTASCWVLSGQLSKLLGISGSFDSLIAIAAIVTLVLSKSLKFEEFVEQTNWGILLLFGGGLALSGVLQTTGASAWMANNIAEVLPHYWPWLLLFCVCLFAIFLTELVSNTASGALLIPLFVTVAGEFGYSGEHMAVMIAICSSCAFMLPVATPPNALVFSTGRIPQRTMMIAGASLNVIFALLLATLFMVFR